jgi:hypothetical protein
MAGLLRGVAEGARGLFVQDSDEELDDAGVEALLVRCTDACFETRCQWRLTGARAWRRSAWTAASPQTTGVRRWLS